MIKSAIIMISAFVLFIAGSSINSEEKIIINQNFPTTISAGDEFIVSLSVHKTLIEGLARLQQELPEGFTAEEVESKGADFIFENQSIKFIWVKLPTESDFKVSYKIKTAKNIVGVKSINGVFVYMENGKAQRHNLTAVEIKINEYKLSDTPQPIVTRRMLTVLPENGEYKVELIVRPNNVSESARFTDEIPENFTAELIDAHMAEFSKEKNSVIFNWNKLPNDSIFTISYSVKSGKPGPSPVINGVFLYGDVTSDQMAMKEIPLREEVAHPAEEKPAETKAVEENVTVADTKNVISPNKTIPAPEKGITYKVQISATQKSPVKNSDWFSSKYKINSEVELTYHDGWKKYIIGSFQAYAEASNFRKQTSEKIPDAFVVAYENGMRISVKEAMQRKSLNQ